MPLAREKVITRNWGRPNSWTLDAYRSTGGYAMLEKALGLQPAQIIDEVKSSNLRGRGGAGFPTGMKWSFVPKDSPKPKYLAVNADESEPGHVQGPLHPRVRPAHAAGGHRHRLLRARRAHRLHLRARRVPASRPSGCRRRSTRRTGRASSGRRCWAATSRSTSTWSAARARTSAVKRPAMLESLEGKKGWPRLKPPFPAVVGLFGCPTVVNNVETLAAVPAIFQHGRRLVREAGPEKSGGTRHGVPLGLGEPAGRVTRSDAQHHGARAHREPGLRAGHARGPEGEGGHPRRLVGPGALRRRDGRGAGVRGAQGAAEHGRLGRGHRHGRRHLHGAEPVAGLALLRRGVVRPVHPVPRGHAVDDPHPPEDRGGAGRAGRHRDPAQRGPGHRPVSADGARPAPSARWATPRRSRCTASW